MLSFASSDLPRFFPLSYGFSDTFCRSHHITCGRCPQVRKSRSQTPEKFSIVHFTSPNSIYSCMNALHLGYLLCYVGITAITCFFDNCSVSSSDFLKKTGKFICLFQSNHQSYFILSVNIHFPFRLDPSRITLPSCCIFVSIRLIVAVETASAFANSF